MPEVRNEEEPSKTEARFEGSETFLRMLRLVAHNRRGDGSRSGSGSESGGAGAGEADRPTRIGRFEVIEEVGRGAYGTVLRVKDPVLGHDRAMKVPNPETMVSPTAMARFIDEARKASKVDHPNVVRVIEADEVSSICYMIMEYWFSRTLDDKAPILTV